MCEEELHALDEGDEDEFSADVFAHKEHSDDKSIDDVNVFNEEENTCNNACTKDEECITVAL